MLPGDPSKKAIIEVENLYREKSSSPAQNPVIIKWILNIKNILRN